MFQGRETGQRLQVTQRGGRLSAPTLYRVPILPRDGTRADGMSGSQAQERDAQEIRRIGATADAHALAAAGDADCQAGRCSGGDATARDADCQAGRCSSGDAVARDADCQAGHCSGGDAGAGDADCQAGRCSAGDAVAGDADYQTQGAGIGKRH